MDPSRDGSGADVGLPRSRGDGPSAGDPARSSGAPPLARGWTRDTARCSGSCAPPLARGWTLVRHLVRGRAGGSPARAGMDPCSGQEGVDVDGSPARAGMDPRFEWLPVETLAPRSRGDGPDYDVIAIAGVKAPPLARGWTPASCLCNRHLGSPARAGMDPSLAARPARTDGSPARAGMDPPTRRVVQGQGGSPAHAAMDPGQSGTDALPTRGLPARAGMDPLAIALARVFMGLRPIVALIKGSPDAQVTPSWSERAHPSAARSSRLVTGISACG